MKNIRLWYGDCLELMNNIPDKYVDLILTDNPYEKTQNHWDSIIPLHSLWKQYRRVIKENGVIALFADEPFGALLITQALDIFKYKWIWKKGNKPTGFLNSQKQPLRITEDILIFYHKQPTYNPQMTKGSKTHSRGKIVGTSLGRTSNYGEYNAVNTEGNMKYPQTLLDFPRDTERYHPTQKPVALLEYLVKTYTNKKDIVLDNAMGSGSTGVAAKNLDRRFIGIENNEKYYNMAVKRING